MAEYVLHVHVNLCGKFNLLNNSQIGYYALLLQDLIKFLFTVY